MLKTTLTSKIKSPAVFDKARRLIKPGEECWYGQGFRMGDLAFSRAYLDHWRKRNPDRLLVLLDDSITFKDTHFAREIPVRWVYGDIVDQIWEAEKPNEQFPIVELQGYERLYNQHIQLLWGQLRTERFTPSRIYPKSDWLDSATAKIGVLPPRYATIQPLVDPEHSMHRSVPSIWWTRVMSFIAGHMPIYLLAAKRTEKLVTYPSGVIPCHDLPPTEALSVLAGSSAHLGGETGFTIWASMFGVPIAAAYRRWRHPRSPLMDCRPINFFAPVRRVEPSDPLEVSAKQAATVMIGLYSGQIKESTPA